MGKTKRPVDSTTVAAIRKSARTAPAEPAIGADLPDGEHAYYGGPGPKRGWYLRHVVDGRQVWDRPIDLDAYLDALDDDA